MSNQDQRASLFKSLRSHLPAVRLQAVAAIYEIRHTLGKEGILEALSSGLRSGYQDVVEDCGQRLQELVKSGAISATECLEALLPSLTTAVKEALPCLVKASARMWALAVKEQRRRQEPLGQPATSPTLLLLSVVTCDDQVVGSLVLQCISQWAASCDDPEVVGPMWTHLRPLLVCILVGHHQYPEGKGTRTSAASQLPVNLPLLLVDQLVRAATSFPTQLLPVAELLVEVLQHASLTTETCRVTLVSHLSDLLDILILLREEVNEGGLDLNQALLVAVRPSASVLVQLVWDSAQNGGDVMVVMNAISQLLQFWEQSCDHLVGELGLMSTLVGNKERGAAYALMAQVVRNMRAGQTARVPGEISVLSLMLGYPLLADLALNPYPSVKRWAATVLEATRGEFSPTEPPAGTFLPYYGDLALYHQGMAVLSQLLSGQGETDRVLPDEVMAAPCQWLRSLTLTLTYRQEEEQDKASLVRSALLVGDKEELRNAMQPTLASSLVLGACLICPDYQVQASAARVLQELVTLMPAVAVSFLPVILYQLRKNALTGKAPGPTSNIGLQEAQEALLHCLPPMTGDPAVAPFALRTLQAMSVPTAPERVQCLALRLVVKCWLETGRGWSRLEAALNGCVPPGSKAPLSLRLTRAKLIR